MAPFDPETTPKMTPIFIRQASGRLRRLGGTFSEKVSPNYKNKKEAPRDSVQKPGTNKF